MTTNTAIAKLSRFVVLLDQLMQTISQRQYKGKNQAIAAVYGPYRASVMIITAITFIVIVFGALVPVESAAIAKAHVVVLGNRKTVQHLEGGIVRVLLVKDGDVVKAGQPLLELSDIGPKANRSMLQNQLFVEQASEARLIALRDGKESLQFSAEASTAAKNDAELAKMLSEQTGLFTSQREGYLDKAKTLELRIQQTRREMDGLKAQVQSAAGQLGYVDDEIKTVKEMVSNGLAPKPRLLSLQRERERLAGDKGQYLSSIAKAEQSINETQVQLLNLKNEFQTQNADQLKDTHSKISELQEKLRAASDVVSRTVITSPTEGIVTGLKYHTEGGVIAPGAPILDIIPQTETLVLEVQINPVDIDVVTPGLTSRVVFSAYKARTLPQLTGKVTKVSADILTEQQGMQEASFYKAQVVVDPAELKRLAPSIKLYPGMPAEVYIKTGSRSFLGYLFAPVTDGMKKAFKES
jgi:HlyD family secretion protein